MGVAVSGRRAAARPAGARSAAAEGWGGSPPGAGRHKRDGHGPPQGGDRAPAAGEESAPAAGRGGGGGKGRGREGNGTGEGRERAGGVAASPSRVGRGLLLNKGWVGARQWERDAEGPPCTPRGAPSPPGQRASLGGGRALAAADQQVGSGPRARDRAAARQERVLAGIRYMKRTVGGYIQYQIQVAGRKLEEEQHAIGYPSQGQHSIGSCCCSLIS